MAWVKGRGVIFEGRLAPYPFGGCGTIHVWGALLGRPVVRLGAKGRVVLPAEVREAWALEEVEPLPLHQRR